MLLMLYPLIIPTTFLAIIVAPNVQDCKPLHHGTNPVQTLCLVSGGKITVIFITHSSDGMNFSYKLCNKLLACSHCVKYLGTLLDFKLSFHIHIDYILIIVLIPPTAPYSLIILSSTLYSLDTDSAVD
jgi:hypothetical protein